VTPATATANANTPKAKAKAKAAPRAVPTPELISGRHASYILGMNQFSFLRTALTHRIAVVAIPGKRIQYHLEDVMRVKSELDEVKKTKA
jgi:hypothetical protein